MFCHDFAVGPWFLVHPSARKRKMLSAGSVDGGLTTGITFVLKNLRSVKYFYSNC